MKVPVKKILITGLKWLGGFIAGVLLLLYLIPLVFPGTIAQQVKNFANKSLDGELNFTDSKFSFFTHFPSLTVSLNDFSLKGSAPFRNDTLLKADEVAFGVNLKRLIFDREIKIDEVYVSDAFIDVMVNEKGEANYNVYVSQEKTPDTIDSNTSLRLERVDFENCHIRYNDKSAKIFTEAFGFNYVGKGDLSEDVFDLRTDALIDSLDFFYDGIPYLEKKRVHADLITRINTNSLSFVLEKNELRINHFPLEFTGFFTILKNGYDIDINAISKKHKFSELLSLLPPDYSQWKKDTKIKGQSDFQFVFKGRYDAARNKQPDLGFNLKVTDGFIHYKESPFPLTDFDLDVSALVPSLDFRKLDLKLRKLDFKVAKDFFHADVVSKNFPDMDLKANVKGSVNLQTLNNTIGINAFDIKGTLKADIKARGVFNKDKGLFPKTSGGFSLQNGELKTKYYPNPIKNIKLIASVQNNEGTFEDLKIAVTPASFVFEDNPVYINATLSNFNDVLYDIQAKGELDIAKIYKVFAVEGVDIHGYAKADLSLQGRQSYAVNGQYNKLNNKGTLLLRDITATTEYFPKAFNISEGRFTFENEKMWFNSFSATYGKSDFSLNGYLFNAVNYFFDSSTTIKGSFTNNSGVINVDEFMASQVVAGKDEMEKIVVEQSPKQSGVVTLPPNLDLELNANAKRIEYTDIVLNDLSGRIAINKGKLVLQNGSFSVIGCKVGIDADYDDESLTSANFKLHLKAKDFDVKKAYEEIPLFRELASSAENAEGIISADYTIEGDLSADMAPVYESLKGGGTLWVRDVKVSGYKLFNVLSSKTGKEDLSDPHLEDIEIKSTIKNSIITMEPFKFKVSGFRPKIAGKTSLKGDLDLRIRLGLPPLGIIGVPVVVTGNQDNPKIKIFSKTGEEIPESQYNEELNQVVDEGGREEGGTVQPQDNPDDTAKPAQEVKPENEQEDATDNK
ncbi:AsmA family protein [Flavobacterium beibuense]|uniref:AsmA family protein n=1 Tax=Flavobacterium beibuense TaxID=657326 RepID=A0A444W5V1_9FLAO|nr:AsmA family protein [Flavobacterium beibuense]RYJ41251.1 AsmA family protein [Flavobacterium beibuense]